MSRAWLLTCLPLEFSGIFQPPLLDSLSLSGFLRIIHSKTFALPTLNLGTILKLLTTCLFLLLLCDNFLPLLLTFLLLSPSRFTLLLE
jgi:hypothetical protein